MMKVILWRMPMRSLALCFSAAVQDQFMVRSAMNIISAAATPSEVSNVRSRLRATFLMAMVARFTAPLDQVALVQAADDGGGLGGGRIVGHHHDRLLELLVQPLEQVQDVVGAVAIEIAGG